MKIVKIAMAVASLVTATHAAEDIALTLHDSNGVSAESARDRQLEVILFREHTHIHLKISNKTDSGLTLWQPDCPQGDYAMSVLFRDPKVPDKVYLAQKVQSYTGGMGIPKVFNLAARSDLLVNVDLGIWWRLPFELAEGETREMEIQASYSSEALPEQGALEKYKLRPVWIGTSTSAWEKVRIVNRTGKKVGKVSVEAK